MLQINMQDVVNVLNTVRPYLIVAAIALVAAIIITIAVRKMKVSKKRLVRKSTWICFVLILVIILNMVASGPMYSMISLATGKGTITDESADKATKLVQDITAEGIVLLKNQDKELPLQKKSKINVFGWASTNPCYGGTGSGSLSDAYPTTDILQSLANAGFETNEELSKFYTDYRADRPVVGMWEQDWTLPEPTAASYSDKLISSAQKFSDTAMIVITRVGGEGADLPIDMSKITYNDNSKKYKDFEAGEHYLQLSKTEKDMIDLVTSKFDKVVVVYNGANAMELGWINEYPQIKSALWVPGTGQSGFESLGKILDGDINPSGRTSDTFVADLTAAPTWNNFGDFKYDNTKDLSAKVTGFDGKSYTQEPTFVDYTDGIYVGYRFYETAAAEGLIDYDKTVVYPFGYGLSYTSFEQKMSELKDNGDSISFDVTVTNTGDAAGKDVVEVYYNPPYTNGGIEKSTANLADFAKTKELAPGKSQKISFEIAKEDLASYDYKGAKAYVLEQGDYEISINANSHNKIASKTLTVDKTITYSGDSHRSSDKTEVTNQFDHMNGDLTYLSRADHFANYKEATAAPKTMSMTDEQKKTFMNNDNYNVEDYNNKDDKAPTTGADNGLTLADLRGKDYDDKDWDKLLDQLTVSDMDTMIALCGYQTPAAESVGKIQTIDCDGPASINNNFTKVGSVGFPSAVLIANTWNTELAESFGSSIGEMANEMGVSGWYAPAMNTHRSAFAGRNFEYYSEDPVLAGAMASNAVKGAAKHGVYAYIKHFAMNDQETNRTNMLCVWANEQAIREIYLKPFEECVKDGKAMAAMTSFTYNGTIPTEADPALLNNVLRGEWGFKGFCLTDYFGVYGYQDADRMIRGGTDAMLVAYDTETNHLTDTKSATGLLAARQACKNIMYTVVNSRAYDPENLQTGLQTWQKLMYGADVACAAVLILLFVLSYKKYKKDVQAGI